MIHVLAQDFNKFRPAAKLATLLISKRDVNAVLQDKRTDKVSRNYSIKQTDQNHSLLDRIKQN